MKTKQEQIKEMTSDKIKKALECCAKSYGDDVHCSNCPYDTLTPRTCCERFCQDVLCKDALELINEQEESIQMAQQNQEYREQQVKQAQIDVLNKIKNCREATDSDCYPYIERIVNKLIKEVENDKKDV